MIKRLLGKTTFIVGNKKNSGKTTFLNGALAGLREKGKIAYLSIGVDGETKDQIFGFNKPRVFAERGDHVVTLEETLKFTCAKFRKLKTFPYKSVLGRPVLIKIEDPANIEIIGPENNTQLSAIIKYLHGELKIRTILVDGAINRITQVASFGDAQFVYMCRVDPERVQGAADELKRVVELSRVPCHCEPRRGVAIPRVKLHKGDCFAYARNDTLLFRGALTPSKAAKIGPAAKKVVVEDFTKVFLNYKELQKFSRSHKLYFQNGFKLSFAVANLFGVERAKFLKALSDNKLAKKLVINEIGAG